MFIYLNYRSATNHFKLLKVEEVDKIKDSDVTGTFLCLTIIVKASNKGDKDQKEEKKFGVKKTTDQKHGLIWTLDLERYEK